MTFNIEIRGMSFFYADDGTRKFRTLALAEVYLPDLNMTLRDVRLAWSADRGFVAHAPSSPKNSQLPIVQWFHRGPFAQQLAGELRSMFERMGGKMPEPMTEKELRSGAATRRIVEKASSRRDHVTGKTIGEDPFERRGISIAQVIDFKEQAARRDEAVEGLLRTIGVEQQEVARVLG